jgi:hypothetical protein
VTSVPATTDEIGIDASLIRLKFFRRLRTRLLAVALIELAAAFLWCGNPATLWKDIAYLRGVAQPISTQQLPAYLDPNITNAPTGTDLFASSARRTYRLPALSVSSADFWFRSRFSTRHYWYVDVNHQRLLVTTPTPSPPANLVGTFYPATKRTIQTAQDTLTPSSRASLSGTEFRVGEDRRWLWAFILTLRISAAVRYVFRGIKRIVRAIHPLDALTPQGRAELMIGNIISRLPDGGTEIAHGRLFHHGRRGLLSIELRDVVAAHLEQHGRIVRLAMHTNDSCHRIVLTTLAAGTELLARLSALNPTIAIGQNQQLERFRSGRPNSQAHLLMRRKRRRMNIIYATITVVLSVNAALFVKVLHPAYESESPRYDAAALSTE